MTTLYWNCRRCRRGIASRYGRCDKCRADVMIERVGLAIAVALLAWYALAHGAPAALSSAVDSALDQAVGW